MVYLAFTFLERPMFLNIFLGFLYFQSSVGDSLHRYGIDGDLTPTFLSDTPSKGFFSLSQSKAIAAGLDYWSSLEMNQVLFQSGSSMQLTLENPLKGFSDIIISGHYKDQNKVENFLVRVKPESEVSIIANDFWEYEYIDFVCMQPFSGRLDIHKDHVKLDSFALFVRLPANRQNNKDKYSRINSCTPNYSKYLFVIHQSGPYVLAYFVRVPIAPPKCHWRLLTADLGL